MLLTTESPAPNLGSFNTGKHEHRWTVREQSLTPGYSPMCTFTKIMNMMAHTCNPVTWRWRPEDQKLKAILFLCIELSPDWATATGEPVSINQTIFKFPKEVSGLQQKLEGN